jgi:response regulator RpfG family c-di-GMP phosphodiesterase
MILGMERHKPAGSHKPAKPSKIKEKAGTQFDPELVEVFLSNAGLV